MTHEAEALDERIARGLSADGGLAISWDTRREAFFLGGLLTLRAESVLLAQTSLARSVVLHTNEPATGSGSVLVNSVFGDIPGFSARYDVDALDGYWPYAQSRHDPFFSHGSFGRIRRLLGSTGSSLDLAWSPALQASVIARLADGGARMWIAVHLKNVPSLPPEHSNALQEEWLTFFRGHRHEAGLGFLLLGSDVVDPRILELPNVRSAQQAGWSLAEQLAAPSLARGFLGMASGICQAAIFSRTPYVVFKNPGHHREQMQAELGEANAFPFALPRQELWREWDVHTTLDRALNVVLET